MHDFGETSAGQLYFVMEFVQGMDIHQYPGHNGGTFLIEIFFYKEFLSVRRFYRD